MQWSTIKTTGELVDLLSAVMCKQNTVSCRITGNWFGVAVVTASMIKLPTPPPRRHHLPPCLPQLGFSHRPRPQVRLESQQLQRAAVCAALPCWPANGKKSACEPHASPKSLYISLRHLSFLSTADSRWRRSGRCCQLQRWYGVMPDGTWGTLAAPLRQWWRLHACDSAFAQRGERCNTSAEPERWRACCLLRRACWRTT